MYTYELQDSITGPRLLRSDGALIGLDFANTDFQAFIRWLQAGNALPGLPPLVLSA